MAQVTDNFNRADAADLGGNWSGVEGTTLAIVSNRASTTLISTYQQSLYTAQILGSDQYAQVEIDKVGTAIHFYDVKLRFDGPSSSSGYQVYINVQSGFWGISRYDSGSGTDIASDFAASAPNAGDVLRGEIEGSEIRIYLNGVLLGSANDATYSGPGYAGVGIFASESLGSVDNFEAGDLGGANLPPLSNTLILTRRR